MKCDWFVSLGKGVKDSDAVGFAHPVMITALRRGFINPDPCLSMAKPPEETFRDRSSIPETFETALRTI